ncbi:dihydroorotate dehydrogenase electron transfer subunit [Rhizobium leguminosarum bv. viciae]|nr:dihydroorotate dehydrogenase electron transfer subunit [Rhizobium leguminosarum bv. viciae]
MTAIQHSDPSLTAHWKPHVVCELAKVQSNSALNAEYRHLIVRCGEEASHAKAGQFFQLLCPSPPGELPFLRRPMSLLRANRKLGTVEFLYKVTGAGTRGLDTLVPGDTLDIMGPLGNGFVIEQSLRSIVLVGRGAGLATLAPVAEEATKAGIKVTAVLSARRPDLFVSEEIIRSYGADIITLSDSENTSHPSAVEAVLRKLVESDRCDAFFTCGSARLILLLQRLAQLYGLPGQAAMEEQMACGLGLCFCCVRDFQVGGELVSRRVCFDGPVFDLQEVARA